MPERVVARLPQAVILIDSELVIDSASPAAVGLLGGGSPGDPLPDPWPDFSLREFAASLFGPDPPEGGRLIEVGQRFMRVEGLASSTAETAILVVDDVSRREQARRSEREFVENAAHELLTPLAAIVSVIDVLESGAKDFPEPRDRFIRHLRVHSERLARLARSLLALARLQTGLEQPRLTVIRLQPLLAEIAAELEPFDGVEVLIRSSAQTGALADPDLLHRAIANLAENAAKHTSTGEIVLEARENGTITEIEIRDTGTGMTDEERARAFQRFYRSSNGSEGFGLGLAIAQEAVHALAGTIELESVSGAGTRVCISVPAARIID